VLTRFASYDSASPFGDYGINGYSYCLGDPLNYRDPSGHFLGILIGVVVGAVVGAAVSAVSEGIRTVMDPDHKFDWKQVAIGASLGAISGGFGVAAQGAKASVKLGLEIAEIAISESVTFATDVVVNDVSVREAAGDALISGTIGLLGISKPKGVGSSGRSRSSDASVKNKEKVPKRRTASEKVTSNREKIKRDVPSESVYTTGGDTENFRGFPNEASLGTDTFLLSRSMTEDDITELHKLTGAAVTAAKESALSTHGFLVVDAGILYFSEVFRVYKQR
jgi:hypothetical protein